jgi:A/G-specific adenine glycosylase
VILQQTQAGRGAEYYERFVERFPDVSTLARAELDDVLQAWAGLGYYARARNLHAAARRIVERFGGRIPDTYEDLRSLPGIGDYIASAILSMAFGWPVAAVEANAIRIIARLVALRTPPQRAEGRRAIDAFAQALVAKGRAREINQAIMDLGATVCLPRRPDCPRCPLSRRCRAKAGGVQDELPVRPARRRPRTYPVGVALIEGEGMVVLARREEGAALGGLWELPGARCNVGERLEACVRRAVRESVGRSVRVRGKVLMMPYSISGAHLRIHVFRCRFRGQQPGADPAGQWRWVTWESALGEYGLSSAVRRLLEEIRA